MASDFARYIANLRQSLFDEQILDERFLEIEKFETTNEGFLDEISADYFGVAATILGLMVPELQGPPYNVPEIKRLLNRFNHFTTRCMVVFEGIKRENELLQSRMENYLKTRKQGPPAEIEDRPEYGYMDSDSE